MRKSILPSSSNSILSSSRNSSQLPPAPWWGSVIFSSFCLHKREAGRRTPRFTLFFCFFLMLFGNMLMTLPDPKAMTNLECCSLAHYDGVVNSHLPLWFSSQTLPDVFPNPSTKSLLQLLSIWESKAYSCLCIRQCRSVALTARPLVVK